MKKLTVFLAGSGLGLILIAGGSEGGGCQKKRSLREGMQGKHRSTKKEN